MLKGRGRVGMDEGGGAKKTNVRRLVNRSKQGEGDSRDKQVVFFLSWQTTFSTVRVSVSPVLLF